MAGSELSGPAGARADLFADRVWVLTPGAAADLGRVDEVDAFAAAVGAVVLRWDADAHDRAVALTSHAPQLVSSLLAAQLAVDGAADTRLSGQGLRDMTRIAASDPALWTQILTANAGPVADVLAPLGADLEALVTALREVAADGPESGPAADSINLVLRRGNEGRERIPGKHGATAVPTSALVVAVADQPGELARLFALAGEVGVNLEDVRIDHALGRPTGLVELTVAVTSAAELVTALRQRGWDVRE